MKKARKEDSIKEDYIRKELKEIDALFAALEMDKSLPSFGEFFITCLIVGNAECVNLKRLYPKLFKKLNGWIESQNRKITAGEPKL